VRIRIHFRGLVVFWFPEDGADAGKLVAELISDPRRLQRPGRPHEHRAEIQEITAKGGVRNIPPNGVDEGRIDITVRGPKLVPPVTRSASFDQYVPRLSEVLAAGTTDAIRQLPRGVRDMNYVRNTVVVDRGQIRVKDVVIWDAGGFPLNGGAPDGILPSLPTVLKFLGSEKEGHMANECVIDIPDVAHLSLRGPRLKEDYDEADHRPNRPGGNDAVELLITNYEAPRGRPTPWGMDFQWLFATAGYPVTALPTDEFAAFQTFATRFEPNLFDEDWLELMNRGQDGRPFPYIAEERNPFVVRQSMRPLNDIDSRPVCVPAIGGP
jgi:hypothetical protein